MKTQIFLRVIEVIDPDSIVAGAFTGDGELLCHHWSSSIEWARHDLGMPDCVTMLIDGRAGRKHDIYNQRFPEGWELVDQLQPTPTTRTGNP